MTWTARSRGRRETEADRFKAAFAQVRRRLPLLALFGLGINLLFLTTPLYLMQTFDRVLSSGHLETLVLLTLIAVGALLFMGALEAVRMALLGRIGTWLERTMAPHLIDASVRGSTIGLPGNAQPLRDLSAIRNFVGSPSLNAFTDLPWMPVFLFVAWMIHPWLGMIGLAAVVVQVLMIVLNELASRKLMKRANAAVGENQSAADTAVRNSHVLLAMGMLGSYLASWTARNDEALRQQATAGGRSSLIYGLTKFLRQSVQVAIIGTGAYLVLDGRLTAGGMIAASIIINKGISPLDIIVSAWRSFTSARDAYSRLIRRLELVEAPRQGINLPPPLGRLTCEEVSYIPPGLSEPVLQGFSFRAEPGTIVGIIGPSASGKSTLARVLVGIVKPTRGHARLDGADIYDWWSEHRGAHVGYLPQDIELFEGTIKTNIARLDPDPEDQDVIEAAELAGMHETILRLPDGYDTRIGDSGMVLSGGQRQRIGLARALYGRPRLVVLDEPNASLDAEGELALVRALERCKEWGATVLVAAHQLHVLRSVDRLMVIRNGSMEMFGPREEVLERLRPRRQRAPAPAEATPELAAAQRRRLRAASGGSGGGALPSAMAADAES